MQRILTSLMTTKSQRLFREAEACIPGGVNSPVRAFKAVGGNPIFIARGQGSHIFDVDGNEYIDYVCSWGPLILGHRHPNVVAALRKALGKGTSYGAPTEAEVEFAQRICRLIPSIEKVRLVNSGTEATMSAIRLARAFTGRSKIIKFDGCYHGHGDSLLVKAGSGVATLGLPDSPGIPPQFASETLSLPYNDTQSAKEAVARHKNDIAGLIIEPVVGNAGVILPKKGYLQELRTITAENRIVLIFDEVITGFRLALGGAQQRYRIKPDLTCLGKIIGGGLPVGAYGGRREIMSLVAPEGPVYQAGTLSGNPLAVAAGLTTLRRLERSGGYDRLETRTAELCDGLSEAARRAHVPITVNRIGSMFTIFFTDSEVYDYQTAKSCHTQWYGRFFKLMLERNIYLPPSQFEAGFVSLAHTQQDINKTIRASRDAFRKLASFDADRRLQREK